ncbi:MAG TPA: FAD-dependent oxidoreductase [Candidatus Limnocylindrales bacterium]
MTGRPMGRGSPTPDVAVIGGGILGTTIAAFLADAGLRVRLYERSGIAAGASGRNSGIVQHPFDPVLADLYQRSLAEYRALAARDEPAFGFPAEPAGLLYVGHDRSLAVEEAARWAALWPDARPEVLADAALRALEPALVPGLAACRLAIGYPIAPASATLAFATLAADRGVEIVIGGSVEPVMAGDRVVGIRGPGPDDIAPAGAVVLAAGPATPGLVDPSGRWRPVVPVWGVVASVALANAPGHGLEAIDIDIEPGGDTSAAGEPAAADAPSDADVSFSLVPTAGSSALGSTFLAAEPDPDRWLEALRRVGARYVPGVADAPLVGLRHCARPVSRDGRPLIGPAPWCDGLWIATGHGPWGISTGPGSARLLVDRMLDPGTAIAAELAVDRFGLPQA